MSTVTEAPAGVRTALKDFLVQLADDAYGYRHPDGCCMHCVKSSTNRCENHARDEELAQSYLAVFRAVDEAGDDEEAFTALRKAALKGEGTS